jgi:ribosomal protein S18 acetylase RimI-like enzyme
MMLLSDAQGIHVDATKHSTDLCRVYTAVANLHAANINQGFLPSLGTRFLYELYRCIGEHPKCFLIAEEHDGKVMGFIAGTTGKRPLRSVLLRHPFRVFTALLLSFTNRHRIAGVLAVARHVGSDHHSTKNLPRAELLSMAVDVKLRGQGCAERLFKALETQFSQANISEFRIVAGSQLTAACRFYGKMGATEVARFELHKGVISIIFRKSIPTYSARVRA